MNIFENVFSSSYKMKTVDNPVTLSKDNCKLLTTKKENYYTHKYDPSPYLSKLKTEYNISDEILSRFIDTPSDKCCNAISITLYNKDCLSIIALLKYLRSINRTVKNVNKKLKDWLVRLYLDVSVYECINTINLSLKNSTLTQIQIKLSTELLDLFKNIVNSINVEVYTFICNDQVNLEKTRTYRYLVLLDPEVNISAIREADGYINYLECHNLKMFQKSDKLFYLPPAYNNANLISNKFITIFNSYSPWLQFYKTIIDRKYFINHQNIYDLLAGLFTIKLKLKSDFYYKKIADIASKLSLFNTTSITPEIRTTYIDSDIPHREHLISIELKKEGEGDNYIFSDYDEYFKKLTPTDFDIINNKLQIGIDEILLLELFKEIISFEFKYINQLEIDSTPYTTKIEEIKNLFYSYNIKQYEAKGLLKNIGDLITILKKDGIIENSFILEGHMNINISKYKTGFIDSIILKNIIGNIPFNIINNSDMNIKNDGQTGNSLLYELNNYYDTDYDKMYDEDYIPEPIHTPFELNLSNLSLNVRNPGKPRPSPLFNKYLKYLKYKNKYLKLKNNLNYTLPNIHLD